MRNSVENGPASGQELPLDVGMLIEQSQPRPRGGWVWYVVGAFILILLMGSYSGPEAGPAQQLMHMLSGLLMMGLVVVMAALPWFAAKRQRAEQEQLEAIEELVQLRRWPEAASMLRGLLSQPTRTPHARIQAMIYLAAVLARYHRWSDAVHVYEYLMEHVQMDPGTLHGLRLGRVMAMLQEDRLFDADRAISELRREAGSAESGGLGLVEIYRDVKTGHFAEALDVYETKLPVMARQLGHRVGDVHALAARAYDLLGREAEAAAAYEKATLLSPLSELQRRYSEVASLAAKYKPAPVPAGMFG